MLIDYYFPLNKSHLLKALTLALYSKKECIIYFESSINKKIKFLYGTIVLYKKEKMLLIDGNIFSNIPYLRNSYISSFKNKNYFRHVYNLLVDDLGVDFLNNKRNVFIFHDGHPVSKSVLRKAKDVFLIEDGLANLSCERNGFFRIFYHILLKRDTFYNYMGDNLNINKIILFSFKVNDDISSSMKKKVVYFDYFAEMNKNKDLLVSIFSEIVGLKFDCNIKNTDYILLTQPFERDLHKYTKEYRVNFFNNIILKIKEQGFSVTLKAHPSEDSVDYLLNEVDCNLSSHFPIELQSCFLNRPYKYAIALYSTSIYNKKLALYSINLLSKDDWVNRKNLEDVTINLS